MRDPIPLPLIQECQLRRPTRSDARNQKIKEKKKHCGGAAHTQTNPSSPLAVPVGLLSHLAHVPSACRTIMTDTNNVRPLQNDVVDERTVKAAAVVGVDASMARGGIRLDAHDVCPYDSADQNDAIVRYDENMTPNSPKKKKPSSSALSASSAASTTTTTVTTTTTDTDDTDNPPPTTTKILWRRVTFEHIPPARRTVQESAEIVQQSILYNAAISAAAVIDDEELQAKLASVKKIVCKYVDEEACKTDNLWLWLPTQLKSTCVRTGEGDGIYMIVDTHGRIKVGMSMSCYERVMQQEHSYAARLWTLDQIEMIVPDEVVDAIMDLELPGLVFHPDHIQDTGTVIRLQLAEAVMTSLYKTKRGPLCERLFQVPSATAIAALTPPVFSDNAIEFMRGIRDGSMNGFFSWPTLRSRLYDIMVDRDSDFLRAILPPQPDDKFVTLCLSKEAWSTKFGGWTDAVKKSPREGTLERVVTKLDVLLQGEVSYFPTDSTCAKIRDATDPIRGENKSHYVHPSSKEMGESMRDLVESFSILPVEESFFMERYAFLAMMENDRDWVEDVFDMESVEQCLPESPWALSMIRAKSGRRVIVLSSHFLLAGVDIRKTMRKQAASDMFALEALLAQSGNKAFDKVENHKKVLLSFLMALEFADKTAWQNDTTNSDAVDDIFVVDEDEDDDDDTVEGDSDGDDKLTNVRGAIWHVLPKGYCKFAVFNGRSVPRSLGMGYLECLYLREHLGKEKFHKLLIAFNLAGNGMQAMSPLEPTFQCEGPPAYGDIPAEPCMYPRTSENPVSCVGTMKNKDHVFHGLYLCRSCFHKLPRREILKLEDMEEIGEEYMTYTQVERLAELRRFRQEHRDRNPTTETVRARTRTNPPKRKNPRKRKSSSPPVKKKKREIRRSKMGAKHMYPDGLIQQMSKAIEIWITLYGQEKVFVTHADQVCDVVLLREWEQYGLKEPKMTIGGIGPFFHGLSYDKAMKAHLEKRPGKSSHYYVLNAEKYNLIPSGETIPILLEKLAAKLYPTTTASPSL